MWKRILFKVNPFWLELIALIELIALYILFVGILLKQLPLDHHKQIIWHPDYINIMIMIKNEHYHPPPSSWPQCRPVCQACCSSASQRRSRRHEKGRSGLKISLSWLSLTLAGQIRGQMSVCRAWNALPNNVEHKVEAITEPFRSLAGDRTWVP